MSKPTTPSIGNAGVVFCLAFVLALAVACGGGGGGGPDTETRVAMTVNVSYPGVSSKASAFAPAGSDANFGTVVLTNVHRPGYIYPAVYVSGTGDDFTFSVQIPPGAAFLVEALRTVDEKTQRVEAIITEAEADAVETADTDTTRTAAIVKKRVANSGMKLGDITQDDIEVAIYQARQILEETYLANVDFEGMTLEEISQIVVDYAIMLAIEALAENLAADWDDAYEDLDAWNEVVAGGNLDLLPDEQLPENLLDTRAVQDQLEVNDTIPGDVSIPDVVTDAASDAENITADQVDDAAGFTEGEEGETVTYYDIAEYFPLNQTDTWETVEDGHEWQVEGEETQNEQLPVETRSASVEETETLGGREYLLRSVDAGSAYLYAWTFEGLICPKWYDSDNEYALLEPDRLLLPRIMSVGDLHAQTVDVSYYDADDQLTDEGTISLTLKLAAVEDVTVTAGTFTSCLKFERTETTDLTDYSNTSTETVWMAKDVGIVKQTSEHTGAYVDGPAVYGTGISLLVRATVNEQDYGSAYSESAQTATIAVDGDASDWAELTPAFSGTDLFDTEPEGTDIKNVYTAMDENNVYIMVEVFNPPIDATALVEANFDYKAGQHWVDSDRLGSSSRADIHMNIGTASIVAWNDDELDGTMESYTIDGEVVSRGTVLEASIPRSQLESCEWFIPAFAGITPAEVCASEQVALSGLADDATDVAITQLLEWTAANEATSYDVYLGTTDPPAYQANTTGTNYDPGTLSYGTTYYWRIDSRNSSGTTTGTVWSFQTEAIPLPDQAATPDPSDGATDVAITQQLGWAAATHAASYDVYFGTTDPPAYQTNAANISYDPGALSYSTTYYWRIDSTNSSGTTTGTVWSFQTPAGWTQTTNPSDESDRPVAIAQDTDYLYIGGYDTNPSDNQWRIEKRNKSDGELVYAVTSNPLSPLGNDRILGITVDESHLYAVGRNDNAGDASSEWRIEKRDKTTGDLDTGFGTGGVIAGNYSAGYDHAFAVIVHNEDLYVGGEDSSTGLYQFRVEKRDRTTGALDAAFGDNGVVTGAAVTGMHAGARCLLIENNDLYVSGWDGDPPNFVWRLEKRDKDTGELDVSFGTDGIATSTNNSHSVVWEQQVSIGIDTDSLYVGGRATLTPVPVDTWWRIEKRSKTTGALDVSFGTDGVIASDPSVNIDLAYGMILDDGYLYMAGDVNMGQDGGRIEKRDTITGDLVSGFGTDGVVTTAAGETDSFYAIISDSIYLYLVGDNTVPGNDQWRIEKRIKATGGQ
ncbi:hypothetical protein ACFL01_02050 [Planctomycetota bacterium]